MADLKSSPEGRRWSTKRISLEHRLQCPDSLHGLVDSLVGPSARRLEYHATLLHLGRPADLIRFLHDCSGTPRIDSDLALSQLSCILERFLPRFKDFVAGPIGTEIFSTGTSTNLLVVSIAYPQSLRVVRSELWEELTKWMMAWGGESIRTAVKVTPDLRWSTPGLWNPHVTLGPVAGNLAFSSSIALPENLRFSSAQLRHGPLRLA